MKSFGLYKVLLFVLSGLLIGVCSVFGVILVQTYNRYENFQNNEMRLRLEVSTAQSDFQERESYLNRLLEDPAFFERVVRKRLGYAEENEIIFRFEEKS